MHLQERDLVVERHQVEDPPGAAGRSQDQRRLVQHPSTDLEVERRSDLQILAQFHRHPTQACDGLLDLAGRGAGQGALQPQISPALVRPNRLLGIAQRDARLGDQRLEPIVLTHRGQHPGLFQYEGRSQDRQDGLQHGEARLVVLRPGRRQPGVAALHQPTGDLALAELDVDIDQASQVRPASLPCLELRSQFTALYQQELELRPVADLGIQAQRGLDRLARTTEVAETGERLGPHHPYLGRAPVLFGEGIEHCERLGVAPLLHQGGEQHADEAIAAKRLQPQGAGLDQRLADGADRQHIVAALCPLRQGEEFARVALQDSPIASHLRFEAQPALALQLVQMSVGQGHERSQTSEAYAQRPAGALGARTTGAASSAAGSGAAAAPGPGSPGSAGGRGRASARASSGRGR